MTAKRLVGRGIGFNPGSVKFIVTAGLGADVGGTVTLAVGQAIALGLGTVEDTETVVVAGNPIGLQLGEVFDAAEVVDEDGQLIVIGGPGQFNVDTIIIPIGTVMEFSDGELFFFQGIQEVTGMEIGLEQGSVDAGFGRTQPVTGQALALALGAVEQFSRKFYIDIDQDRQDFYTDIDPLKAPAVPEAPPPVVPPDEPENPEDGL